MIERKQIGGLNAVEEDSEGGGETTASVGLHASGNINQIYGKYWLFIVQLLNGFDAILRCR